jgi:hypothetical protein
VCNDPCTKCGSTCCGQGDWCGTGANQCCNGSCVPGCPC